MSNVRRRLFSIQNILNDIDFIMNSVDFKVTYAIENKILKPAIRMHIIKLTEQFNKLKDDNAFQVLEKFDPNDLRGLNAIRNFIAHDYDSVDDGIIEDVIRENLPQIKEIVNNLLEDEV